jgi:hypothetical protein
VTLENDMFEHVPVRDPRPNITEFIDIILGRTRSARVPLVEYIVDDVVMQPIVSELMGRRWVDWGPGREMQTAYLDNFIAFWRGMGYDFVRLEISLPFTTKHVLGDDPTMGPGRQRS